MDLVASFTHDVELAPARRQEVTMVTMDVLGAFDAVWYDGGVYYSAWLIKVGPSRWFG